MSNTWQRWKGIQKAYPFEEKRLAKWKPPYIVQPKYDGIRCRAVPTNTGYILLSSEENVIFSVPHINTALNDWENTTEMDGELYCHNMSFEEISSRVMRTVNLHSDYEAIQYHIFDEVADWPQMQRLSYIYEYKLSPPLVLAPFWLCYNLEEIMRIYDHLITKGYEGIIVRQADAPYERKRSIWVMKFKPKKEDLYEVIGFTEEIDKEGNLKDTLGALVCSSGDGKTFNVGTGFTEERRKHIWEGRDLLRGSKARVKYQHITSGNKVPRFPVFVEIEVET